MIAIPGLFRMGAILYLVCILSGFVFPKQRWLILPVAIMLSVMTYGAIGAADYIEYSEAYNSCINQPLSAFRYPAGWMILCKLFVSIGFSYQLFEAAVVLISVIFASIGFSRVTKSVNLALSLFLLYPAIMECVQIRSFLAISICFLSSTLLREINLKNVVLYLALVILSMTLHSAAISFAFFAVLAVVFSLIERGPKRFGNVLCGGRRNPVVWILCLLIGIFVFSLAVAAPQLFTFFLHPRDATYLMSLDVKPTTVLRTIPVFMLYAFTAYYARKEIGGDFLHEGVATYSILVKLYVFSLAAVIPFLLFDYNFYRFIRFATYMVIAIVCCGADACRDYRSKNQLIAIGIAACVAGCSLDLFWTLDSTAYPMLGMV